MAEGEEIARVCHTSTQELSNVSSALTTKGIAANIPKFDGNPKNFREWVKSIYNMRYFLMYIMKRNI